MRPGFILIALATIFLFACFPEPVSEPYEPPPVIVDPPPTPPTPDPVVEPSPPPAPPTTGEVVTDIIEAADPILPEKVKPWIGLALLIAGWWTGNRRGTNVGREIVRGLDAAKRSSDHLASAFDENGNTIRSNMTDRARRLISATRP